MQQKPLGTTSLNVSRVSLGTMTFGAQVNESDAANMVDVCLEGGVNFIDTANVYNAGQSESILGHILRGRRDRAILATKVGIKTGDGPGEFGLSAQAIRQGIENSLKRLQTDYVDLFYLHQPDYTTPIEESLSTLNDLVREGKVRHLGASNYAAWQICHMNCLAQKYNWQPIQVIQPVYNLLARRIEQELTPMAQQFKLAVVPYNPLAGGLLTGKHKQDTVPAGTRFDRMPIYKDRYWNEQTFNAVHQLDETARKQGMTLIELAIAWMLSQPAVTSVILGASNLNQLEENVKAANRPPLDPPVIAECDRVWNELRGVSPAYNR